MSCKAGIVRVRSADGSLGVQIEGWGTMYVCQVLRDWVEANLVAGAQLHIDLSRCSFMDSTFIGTLLGFQRLCTSRSARGLTLVCPSRECCAILDQMRIGRVFAVESQPLAAAAADWKEITAPPEAARSRAFKATVVEAHQCLADCDGPTGEQFRAVADALARELPDA